MGQLWRWAGLPHSLALDAQGRVYVADRGNGRVQIFDADGRYLGTWQDRRWLGRPWAIRIRSDGAIFVVDGGDQHEWLPDRARILQLSPEGEVVGGFGAYGLEPGQFIWPTPWVWRLTVRCMWGKCIRVGVCRNLKDFRSER